MQLFSPTLRSPSLYLSYAKQGGLSVFHMSERGSAQDTIDVHYQNM